MNCGPRSSCLPYGSRGRGERVAWLPLLFIGTLMFWTLALGLGGWSFMLVNEQADVNMEAVAPMPSATAIEPKPGVEMAGPTGGSVGGSVAIPVQMEESQESEDVDDNAGAVHMTEDETR